MTRRKTSSDFSVTLKCFVDRLEEAITTKNAYDKNLIMNAIQKDMRILILAEEKS